MCFFIMPLMADKTWCRAVWKESDKEEEEVIPSSWVIRNKVYWPRVSNTTALKAIRENWSPKDARDCSWDQFELVKIKSSSDDKKECEDHNITTATEDEGEEEEDQVEDQIVDQHDQVEDQVKEVEGRRVSKKKNFGSDFQSDYSSGRNNVSTKKSSEKSTPSGQKKGMPVPPPPPPPPQSPAVTVAAEVHRDQGTRKTSDVSSKSSKKKARQSSQAGSVSPSPPPRSPTPPSLYRDLSRSRSTSSIRISRRQQSRPDRRNDRDRSQSTCSSSGGRRRDHRARSRSLRSKSREGSRRNRSSRRHRSKSSRRHRSKSSRRHRSKSSRRHRSKSSRRYRSPSARQGENNRTPVFPMPEERYQRRSMYLLVESRDMLKKLLNYPVASHVHNEPTLELEQQGNLEDFQNFDISLNDKREFDLCRATVAKIGGSDFGDHIKKSMERLMTNKLMAKMNMSGKVEKYSFGKSNVFKLLKDVIMTKYGVTEQEVSEKAANYLKWAPDRRGGGGRKK
ncbi:uncharacterized protein [Mytilus edulis]|uniref:uncharacterized protein isoform X2 n=1 Tax=Mytilus edulis TaxID=6550 RepID=UPI0039EF2A6B